MKSGTVALIGRPNSGKSTLFNALIGEKLSIVSPNPQTTRHRILGVHTEDRGQIVFLDTPGIHKPNYRMNRRMLQVVYDALAGIDLLIVMVDGSIRYGGGESFVLETVKKAGCRSLLLINKIDRIAKPKLLPVMERYAAAYEFLEIIPISALERDNLGLVLDKIFFHLPEGAPLFEADKLTDRGERFFAAEFIREKILDHMREELPYSTAVLINKFDEGRRAAKNLVVIEADILVEKSSQQGIILGAGGEQLKQIGIAARLAIESLLDCRVHLSLRVRTAPGWRDDKSVLNLMDVGS